jgi:hypothetical protein
VQEPYYPKTFLRVRYAEGVTYRNYDVPKAAAIFYSGYTDLDWKLGGLFTVSEGKSKQGVGQAKLSGEYVKETYPYGQGYPT